MAQETTNESEPTPQKAEKKNPQPKFIVVDSNVFIADYWVRSPSFVLLRDFLKKTNATLVVPKVVFEEVINHQREDVGEVESEIRKSLRNVSRLIRNLKGQDGSLNAISRQSTEDPYFEFLSSELASMNAKIADYSDIPHDEVVRRDLKRRKPFQESGKGYRDTLLWETVLRNCIEQGSITVFITTNAKDFCDSTGDLHKDLKLDILRRKVDKDSIKLFRDLPTFTDSYIVPYLTKRKDFAVLVQNNKVPGLKLYDVCEENIDTLTEAVEKRPSVMIGDPGQYEPEVGVIEIPGNFDIEEASELSKNVLLVVFEFDAEVYFTYFLPHSEYATMADEESANISILEGDWNEYVMRVEAGSTVRFMCRLTFNADKQEVESFEVEAVEKVHEYN